MTFQTMHTRIVRSQRHATHKLETNDAQGNVLATAWQRQALVIRHYDDKCHCRNASWNITKTEIS